MDQAEAEAVQADFIGMFKQTLDKLRGDVVTARIDLAVAKKKLAEALTEFRSALKGSRKPRAKGEAKPRKPRAAKQQPAVE